ncbi:MAG: HAMP domain-containing protein [Mycolicibacterium hassiacum]|uniref:ATP-binding protein n=1 Tax=Mycolicibacterium hassiacum TaxID=46351 RepID=UPI0023F97890|nr:ATP-binding protein [Mycolicibacterium hassiacum]MBX5486202.1 HAMP domain-containing protein [Mycolicibacterium hassiacum]
MSVFSQLKQADGTVVDFEREPAPPPRRPSRWSLANWPVRLKVLAIVAIPLLLAAVFGGTRIHDSVTDAVDLRRASDRAEMVPAIVDFMTALDRAVSAGVPGTDPPTAITEFDTAKRELQRGLDTTDLSDDVRQGLTTMIENGQALVEKVAANSINIYDRVTSYAPILLTAEETITSTVRADDERVTAETRALSRAVGVRGQMTMQRLLVIFGGELSEQDLRTRMIALAGTEPSTLFGLSPVVAVGSSDANTLQNELVKRLTIISDPAAILVNNPELLASEEVTDRIAADVIARATDSVLATMTDRAAAQRTAVIRDAAIVGAAMLLTLLLVVLVARKLVVPLRVLRASALKVAHEELAREIEHVQAGGEPLPVRPIPVPTSEEIGQVAHAVDELHEQAVLLAGEQARLQLQLTDMFETLSRRNRSLVDQQLALIDRLERDEEDPDRLEDLFKLDHLAARMRRNGANLLVLAGAKVPREHAEPVPISAVINAAASEVEDYTRVVTASVPDSEIVGSVAGDLVHLLAELLDNALRYSPPSTQVRVSAVHTGNGGLVIEVADHGLGMTESDLRVANARLQSGGEVTPYTARHMGLFVVGRLAAQHGLVVRLRSTIAGEPGSGTTAGVYVPAGLLTGPDHPDQYDEPEYAVPADAHAGIATALALDEQHVSARRGDDDGYFAGGHGEDTQPPDFDSGPEEYPSPERRPAADTGSEIPVPVAVLPQRSPGASGITDIPASVIAAAPEPRDEPAWPEDSMPAQTPEHAPGPSVPVASQPPAVQPDPVRPEAPPRVRPTNTSGFFAARAQAAADYPWRAEAGPATPGPATPGPATPGPATPGPESAAPAPASTGPAETGPTNTTQDTQDGDEDTIYQRMLSEWLVDPHELANCEDLNWKSVWDRGWSAAAAAEEAPVLRHTEEGLPQREPGARLVPGAADPSAVGRHRNGDPSRTAADADPVRSAAEHGAAAPPVSGPVPRPDPEAIRASISSHFSGVHAGRARARDAAEQARGTEHP